ncbi:hypothetical protein EVAR_66947_1 [Eumeta japonica]|uniref:Uncharacterized protein n=1 Tax=Eumeta variegata TaxID=151549 RepID=A0A4C1SDG4_EUMVA|nr:hypothetical protein EVAR_66947_1 [Eumeta japonica]
MPIGARRTPKWQTVSRLIKTREGSVPREKMPGFFPDRRSSPSSNFSGPDGAATITSPPLPETAVTLEHDVGVPTTTLDFRPARWHWLYRPYCACVIPLFAPQSVRAVRRAGADAPAQPVVFRKLFTVSTRARGAAVSEPAHGLVHRGVNDEMMMIITFRREMEPPESMVVPGL